jgi:hypothetical protein
VRQDDRGAEGRTRPRVPSGTTRRGNAATTTRPPVAAEQHIFARKTPPKDVPPLTVAAIPRQRQRLGNRGRWEGGQQRWPDSLLGLAEPPSRWRGRAEPDRRGCQARTASPARGHADPLAVLIGPRSEAMHHTRRHPRAQAAPHSTRPYVRNFPDACGRRALRLPPPATCAGSSSPRSKGPDGRTPVGRRRRRHRRPPPPSTRPSTTDEADQPTGTTRPSQTPSGRAAGSTPRAGRVPRLAPRGRVPVVRRSRCVSPSRSVSGPAGAFSRPSSSRRRCFLTVRLGGDHSRVLRGPRVRCSGPIGRGATSAAPGAVPDLSSAGVRARAAAQASRSPRLARRCAASCGVSGAQATDRRGLSRSGAGSVRGVADPAPGSPTSP